MLFHLEIIRWKKFRGQPKLYEAIGRVQFGCQKILLEQVKQVKPPKESFSSSYFTRKFYEWLSGWKWNLYSNEKQTAIDVV